MVSETDLLAPEAAGQGQGVHPTWLPHRKQITADTATAGDLMTHPAVTTDPDELVANAARLMHSLRLSGSRSSIATGAWSASSAGPTC